MNCRLYVACTEYYLVLQPNYQWIIITDDAYSKFNLAIMTLDILIWFYSFIDHDLYVRHFNMFRALLYLVHILFVCAFILRFWSKTIPRYLGSLLISFPFIFSLYVPFITCIVCSGSFWGTSALLNSFQILSLNFTGP